jgi:Na+/H+ antiporter NhaC
MKYSLVLIFALISSVVFSGTTSITIPYNGKHTSGDTIEIPEVCMDQITTTLRVLFAHSDHFLHFDSSKVSVKGNTTYVLVDIDGEQVEATYNQNSLEIPLVINSDTDINVKLGDHEFHGEIKPIPAWTSILPPLLAILFALIFKEVLTALLMGIFIGTGIMGIYIEDSFIGIFTGFYKIIDTYVINALNDSGHLSVIVFSMIIGGVVAIISRNGGMQGVVNRISKIANNARNGQMATYILGVVIFFDDYANTLVVGNTMRPVTDRLKISREKLSYLVDSTAAPVAAIAFVTTWIGAELGYVSSGIENINANGELISESTYSVFMNSLAYSFYPIFTLIFMFMLVYMNRDFGPMLKAERRARSTGAVSAHQLDNDENQNKVSDEMEQFNSIQNIKHRSLNAILPIGAIIIGTMIGLYLTGKSSTDEADLGKGFFRDLSTIIGNADSYKSLLWASISGLVVAVFLTVSQKIMNLTHTVETAMRGFKTMLGAILILVLAWSLASVTEDMHTADYLQYLLGNDFAPWLMPAVTFLLAAIVSFSTGTSWGTMAILYPLMLPAAWKVCEGMDPEIAMSIFYNTVSAVLAGAVLGDHCSPISDTTILSSLASSCNHLDHVKTQMPYALTVGVVALLFGTIPTALGISPIISFIVGPTVLFFIIKFIGKKVD